MSVGYTAVQWSRHKRIYDAVVAGGVALFLVVFFFVGKLLWRPPHAISDEILAIRALAFCAFVLLHIILCIGPLTRLDRRFLPLLYNRRHLGVAMFIVALAHAILSVGYYHGFGVVNPLISLLTSNTNFASIAAFPFELLGLTALLILFLMAATSHDFWLKNLGPAAWKRLHMLVYAAYALVVMHVALGFLQTHGSGLLAWLTGAGVALVATLHLLAAWREQRRDAAGAARPPSADGWVDVAAVSDIAESRGLTVSIGRGERVAIFRHNGALSATTNVCAHQGGPLGEGRIIDGCITCPWHGWQYRPSDGRSPPPFTEKISTHRVRVVQGRVQVDPTAMPAGTEVPPARVEGDDHA